MSVVYAISDGSKVKIGFTTDIDKRLSTLQTGNAKRLTLVHTIELPDDRCYVVEQKIHQEYRHKIVRGEWFNLTDTEAREILIFADIRWAEDPLL